MIYNFENIYCLLLQTEGKKSEIILVKQKIISMSKIKQYLKIPWWDNNYNFNVRFVQLWKVIITDYRHDVSVSVSDRNSINQASQCFICPRRDSCALRCVLQRPGIIGTLQTKRCQQNRDQYSVQKESARSQSDRWTLLIVLENHTEPLSCPSCWGGHRRQRCVYSNRVRVACSPTSYPLQVLRQQIRSCVVRPPTILQTKD